MTELRDELQAALSPAYVLERELGRGGMATVYLARDVRHERGVALKVFDPALGIALGPERFSREIKLAAGLQHPHIVAVYDSGATPAGHLWFTMPYVEGESLRDRLRREKQLATDDAVQITREVADALDYAHRHGVIHRDIKPENILLSGGHALVADFGVARALAPEPAGSDAHALTETGTALGTPTYMSPEQATGDRALDGRTDVYALGCVLYEMLAGEAPYTGVTAQVILAKRVSGEVPSVRRLRPAVPAGVDAALTKALAPVPADRFATAADFARALASASPSTGSKADVIRRPPTRRVAVAAGILLLVAVGGVLDWRRLHPDVAASATEGPVRLAVLPFDNLGDSADAYFADGMTDAVRDKLATLPGLEVIASGSSGQYRHSTKPAAEIGRELGVRYLLVGKVRWAKQAGGASRVQVKPELVEAASAADRWGEPFDAPLTDVFQVQTDIAGKVAEQLRVQLGTKDRQALSQRPTQNLDAYDAYLRGIAIFQEGNSSSLQHRQAVTAFEDAVRRDSAFALAWAVLGVAHTVIYFSAPTRAVADSARNAAERAIGLAPDLPEAHAAMGLYYLLVRSDFGRAFAEDSVALTRAPNNAVLLTTTAGLEQRLGRWQAAEAHLKMAAQLDPQSTFVVTNLGVVEFHLRLYAAARQVADRALALRPGNLFAVHLRADVRLAEGDLAGARAVIHAMPAPVDTAALAAYFAQFGDLGWVLDSAQERVLLTLRPEAFDGSRAQWGIVLAQQYALRGDMAHARIYADSARLAFDAELTVTPDDAQRHALRGLALAYLGRKAEAIHEAERATALAPISKDAVTGPYVQHQAVRVYTLTGEKEKALDALEPLLKIPYSLSPGWLRIDPNFAPLRGNPRFEQLLTSQPATIT